MRYEKIYLEDHFPSLPALEKKTEMTLYIPDVWQEIDLKAKFPCVIICPGGGYRWTSPREAEPVALRLAGKGIAAAVLHYACGGTRYPAQLLQISASVTYMRRSSGELHIDPDRIAVMGFSAGGHAACSASLFWQEGFVEKALGIKHGENKPNGMILCYPVITSGEYAHRDSFRCLLGDDPTAEELELVSLEKQVTENAPRAFIWHTAEDGLVPVQNSLLIASALTEKGIPVELHIYPKGHHGMSLCDDTSDKREAVTEAAEYCSRWADCCIKWIKEML